MINFVKEKKISVIDPSKFHVGCAYFVQWDDNGGSWFTGVLERVSEEHLIFVKGDDDSEYIEADELLDSNKNYRISLLVPASDDTIINMAKQQDPIGFSRYLREENKDNDEGCIFPEFKT